MPSRLCLLCLISLASLTGCLYYGDIHENAKPYSAADLAAHVYTIPAKHTAAAGWWEQFHDPQLNQLIGIALADSPDMKIAEARVRRSQQLAQEAASYLFPSVNLSGDVQRARFSETGLVPPPFNGKTFNIGVLGLTLDYDFDLWGKNRQVLAAQVNEACAAQADEAESRLILSAAVANTYFQLLGNIAQLTLAKENQSLAKKMANIITDRARHGIASDIPVKTAISNAETAQLTVQQYQQAEMLARNQLAVLLGNNPFTTNIMTRTFTWRQHDVALPSPLTANVLARRPDIHAAKRRVEAATHQVKAAKARFFPDISLQGLFSYENVGLSHFFDPANQHNAITGAVDLPIFDAGARRANLGVKYAEYDEAVSYYNQTILKALREVSDQLTALSTVKNQLKAQDQAVSATLHNTRLYHSRYNHGIIEYLQVLEIRQTLLSQQAAQLALQVRHQQAVVTLLKTLGGNG